MKDISGLLPVSFWTRYMFPSYNRSGSFLKHLGEPKVNQFLLYICLDNVKVLQTFFSSCCSYVVNFSLKHKLVVPSKNDGNFLFISQ